jgi:transposase InsO family protein
LKRKSEIGPRVIKFFNERKNNYSKTIKVIRCDNARENVALATTCKREELGINFKFTAPGTPQHNGVVERAFATLFVRGRAMMNEAKLFPKSLRKNWSERCN